MNDNTMRCTSLLHNGGDAEFEASLFILRQVGNKGKIPKRQNIIAYPHSLGGVFIGREGQTVYHMCTEIFHYSHSYIT